MGRQESRSLKEDRRTDKEEKRTDKEEKRKGDDLRSKLEKKKVGIVVFDPGGGEEFCWGVLNY